MNGITVAVMLTTLLYLFVNFFILERFILNIANNDRIDHKYKDAITFYNIAYAYYGFNHLSSGNKEIYFSLPYKIAMCYLENNNKKNSVQTMIEGITSIQGQYGTFSQENAYFIRKYLIDYYLANNNYRLAKQGFNNLITIYKTIGYDENVLPDLIRLNGDLYYQQKKYTAAISLYEEAYNKIIVQKYIDYEIFSKIVDRICDFEIQNNNIDKAIEIYNNSISILKNPNNKHPDLTANMLMDLGNLYNQNDLSVKDAINCYEQAIEIIKKLPKTNYLKENIKAYLTSLKDLYNKDGQFHKVDQVEVEISRQERFSFLP